MLKECPICKNTFDVYGEHLSAKACSIKCKKELRKQIVFRLNSKRSKNYINGKYTPNICKKIDNTLIYDMVNDLYFNLKFSKEEIAKVFGTHQSVIGYIFDYFRIVTRSRKETYELMRETEGYKKHRPKPKLGDKNPLWKGGQVKRNGYNVNYISPGNYKLEHILVWEKFNNKVLPKDWLIHHTNGIRDDNRIENLVAMPRKEHETWTYVKILQEHIRELEEKLELMKNPHQ